MKGKSTPRPSNKAQSQKIQQKQSRFSEVVRRELLAPLAKTYQLSAARLPMPVIPRHQSPPFFQAKPAPRHPLSPLHSAGC
jgi:hypothetical protein